MASRQDYFNKIYSGDYTTIARIQFLRREDESISNTVISDILDGSLSITKANGVRRSLDITLKNINSQYKISKYDIWIGSKIRLSFGVKINNEYYFESQGIFIIMNASLNSSTNSKTLSISAVDKFVYYDGQYSGNLFDYIQIENGTNINTAINNVIRSEEINGEKNLDPKLPILTPTSINLSYTLRKGYSDTVASVLQEIAKFSSRNIYYDRFGFLRFEEDFDDTTKGSIWDFNEGKGKHVYISAIKNELMDKVFNSIKVVGADINGNVATAIAKNINPLSDTNINLIGEKFAQTIEDTNISTDDLAEKRADFELKKIIRLNSSITITCLPLYHLDVDEVISVTDPRLELDSERYVIQSINLSLTNNLMSITATNVRELAFDLEV